MSQDIFANCRCGAVKFGSQHPAIVQVACHCDDCRAATGDDFSNIAFFSINDIQMSGALHAVGFISSKGNQTQRLSCAKCKDVMFDKSAAFPHLVGVMTARIGSTFLAAPKIHVWTQSKLDNVVLPSTVKTYPKGIGDS